MIILLTPTQSCGMALNFRVGKIHDRRIFRKINYIPHESQSDLYDIWVNENDFSEQVIEYYKNNNGVKCY